MISDLPGTLEILNRMREAELALAEFYQSCADSLGADRTFWEEISHDEQRHAESLEHMRKALANRPERFEIDRPFSMSEVKAFIEKVKNRHDRVKRRKLPEREVLDMVRELEQSMVETRFHEFLSTRDKEYNDCARTLAVETRKHRDQIVRRMS